MQAIGNGIIAPGQVSVTIGTGAQVFAPIASAIYDKQLRAHTFNNFQQDSWYFMGATLCGGLSLRWLRDTVLGGMPYREMDTQVEAVPRGSDGLIYLPYLSGERTPHMDPLARGMFFGLTLKHSRAHLMRAVMEGVVFSLRDCLELYEQLGQSCRRVIASGGGARSAPWLQMQADIFGKEVYTSKMLEQAGWRRHLRRRRRGRVRKLAAGLRHSHPLERYAGRSGFKGNSPLCRIQGAFPRALPIQPGTDASMHGPFPPGKMKQKPNRFSLSTM